MAEVISIFGLGQVGLVTAVCFAKKGYKVVGIDSDDKRVSLIRKTNLPFYEPGLKKYLRHALRSNKFLVDTDPSLNSESDLAFITVGTPKNTDGSIDLHNVKSAARAIGRSLASSSRRQLIIVKSTVVPGTARFVLKPIIERECHNNAHFGLCSNPEFLREGSAIRDTEKPDRIVIGSQQSYSISKLEKFYRTFYRRRMPNVIRTTHENAELIKYANNAFLATKVSFINSVANIAENIAGADVQVVAAAIGLDRRIGGQFLRAGLGWGGSCLPKDTEALIRFSRKIGSEAAMVAAASKVNRRQWRKAIEFATEALGSLQGKRIAILGLAFKPNTDDMREAVSIPMIRTLLARGATVTAYDPVAKETAYAIFKNRIIYAASPIECLNESDCCIVVTEWKEFRAISARVFESRMRRPVVIDGRRIYDPGRFSRAGIHFAAIGLGPRT